MALPPVPLPAGGGGGAAPKGPSIPKRRRITAKTAEDLYHAHLLREDVRCGGTCAEQLHAQAREVTKRGYLAAFGLSPGAADSLGAKLKRIAKLADDEAREDEPSSCEESTF